MKFQYTLIFFGALAFVIPSGYGLECYNEECEDQNYSCQEDGNPSKLTKVKCEDSYPDRTPICVKTIQYEYTGEDNSNEDNRRVIAVYRRCSYKFKKRRLADCTERPIYGKYQTKDCTYVDNLSNF